MSETGSRATNSHGQFDADLHSDFFIRVRGSVSHQTIEGALVDACDEVLMPISSFLERRESIAARRLHELAQIHVGRNVVGVLQLETVSE